MELETNIRAGHWIVHISLVHFLIIIIHWQVEILVRRVAELRYVSW